MTNKLPRLFYLDFIRAIAVFIIILTHYNALYIYMVPPNLEKTLLIVYPFGIYIGNLGVSIFFIISGAALMYTYEKGTLDVKKFYIKRFSSIYPMWWTACIIAYSYWLLVYKTANPWGAAPWKILLTFIGFDQYFAHLTVTFGIIGEWFLGCIILIYIIFPFIRYWLIKQPIITIAIVLVLYLYFVFFNPWPLWTSVNIFVRLPEFMFGMLFVKFGKNVNWKAFTLALIILATTSWIHPGWSGDLKTTYIGIAFFVVLAYLARFFQNSSEIKYFCSKICKYSYAIFISHHIVIYEVGKKINLNTISYGNSIALFIVCCEIIAVVAFVLYHLHKWIVKQVRTVLSSKSF